MKEKRYHLKKSLRKDLNDLSLNIDAILLQDSLTGFKRDDYLSIAPIFFRFYSRYFWCRHISKWIK